MNSKEYEILKVQYNKKIKSLDNDIEEIKTILTNNNSFLKITKNYLCGALIVFVYGLLNVTIIKDLSISPYLIPYISILGSSLSCLPLVKKINSKKENKTIMYKDKILTEEELEINNRYLWNKKLIYETCYDEFSSLKKISQTTKNFDCDTTRTMEEIKTNIEDIDKLISKTDKEIFNNIVKEYMVHNSEKFNLDKSYSLLISNLKSSIIFMLGIIAGGLSLLISGNAPFNISVLIPSVIVSLTYGIQNMKQEYEKIKKANYLCQKYNCSDMDNFKEEDINEKIIDLSNIVVSSEVEKQRNIYELKHKERLNNQKDLLIKQQEIEEERVKPLLRIRRQL